MKYDLLVFYAYKKLPWIIPIAVNRCQLIADPCCLFNPTGNGKTLIVKIDYRCTGEGICLVEKNGLTARTPSLSKEWQAIKAKTEKKKRTFVYSETTPVSGQNGN